MRQRRVKGIDEKLAAYAGLILPGKANQGDAVGCGQKDSGLCLDAPSPPDGFPVRWYQRTSPCYILPQGFERKYVEFGCGRGQFINALASEDPNALYIGVEGCKTIVIKAMEKTKAAGLKNIRYIENFINDASTAFEESSIDGVFLNFSDPWPKERHAGRRLTAPEKAGAYLRVLKKGGLAVFKTDGEVFFKYSLASFAEAGFRVIGSACELAASALSADIADRVVATPTEYEQRFRALGAPIYHFIAIKCD